MIEPIAIRKGMVLRISINNFSWLMTLSQAGFYFNRVQTCKGATITAISDGFMDGTFMKYAVLFDGRVIYLLEPDKNFHIKNGFIEVLKGKQ